MQVGFPYNVVRENRGSHPWLYRANFMPQAIPILIAAAGSALGTVGTAWAAGTLATLSIGSVLASAAVAALLAGAQLLLAPDIPERQTSEIARMVREPISYRKTVYGRTRPPTNLLYVDITGKNNRYLHLIVAVAAHEIDAFEEIYFNEVLVWKNGAYQKVEDSDRTEYTYTSTGQGEDRTTVRTSHEVFDTWDEYAVINTHLGTNDQMADTDLVNDSERWTNAHRLRGIAYIYTRLRYKQKAFPNGIPSVTAVVRGKKLFDPRDNQTRWSANAALVQRDYLTDTKLGLRAKASEINEASFIAKANLADEQVALDGGGTESRYEINGWVEANSKPRDVLESLLVSNVSHITYSSGQFYLVGGAYSAPVKSFTDDDFRAGVRVQTAHSFSQNFNAVKGTFRDPTSNFIPTSFPTLTSSTYAITDGEPKYYTLPLSFETSSARAQRLAKIKLLSSRSQQTVTLPLKLSALNVAVGDVISVTREIWGWANKTFEVFNWSFSIGDDGTLGVNVIGKETSAPLWDWTTSEEQPHVAGVPTTLPSVVALAPTLISAVPTTRIKADGTHVSYISVNFTPSEQETNYEVQWSTDDFATARSVIVSTGFHEILAVEETTAYLVRVRAVTRLGVTSDWVPATSAAIVTVDKTPPSPISGVTFQPGLGSTLITWTRPAERDYDHVIVHRGTTDSFNDSAFVAKAGGEEFTDEGLLLGTNYHYWFATVDRTGNIGTYIGPFSTTTEKVNAPDIEGTLTGAQIAADAITSSHLVNNAVGIDKLGADVITEIDNAAQSAAADKAAAEAAASAAQTAQANAETAESVAEGARDQAQTAQSQASAASAAAQTAQDSAEAAEASAIASATAASSSEAVAAYSAETASARAAGNLVTDGDFTNYNASDWAVATGDTLSILTTTGVDSYSFARIADTDGSSNASAIKLTDEHHDLAGRTVRISGQYRTDTTDANVTAQIGFNFLRADSSSGNSWQILPSAQVWTSFSHEIMVSSDAVLTRPRIRALGTSTGGWADFAFLRFEDVTSEVAAENHAAASASSASAAATSETNAGVSAGAAATARVAAEAARDAASGSASAAATSESNAGASSTAAGNSATASENSRIAAETAEINAASSASAAATSETNAAASETAAGQSATAADADRVAAQTARSGAEAAESAAVVAQNSATGSSAAALISEGIAVSAANTANARAARNFVTNNLTADGWAATGGDTLTEIINIGSTHSNSSKAIRLLDSDQDGSAFAHEGQFIPGDFADRQFRITGAYRINGDASTYVQLGLNVERESGNYARHETLTHSSAWVPFDALLPITDGQAIGIRPRIVLYNPNGIAGVYVDVTDFRIEDVTESYSAEQSATAAASSETAAAASQSAAANSASVAQTERIAAEAAGVDAAGSASAASTSAINASADATAASASASNASTSASSASTDAGAALGYRNEAQTARNDAEGFAGTASTESGIAVSSAADALAYRDAANARAARNLVTKGEFEEAGEVGEWTGSASTVGQSYHSTFTRALRVQVASSLEGNSAAPLRGNFQSRVLRFTGSCNRVGSTPHLYAGVQAYDPAGSTTTVTAFVTDTNGWQDFEVTVTTPADCVAIRPWVRALGGGSEYDHRWFNLRLEDVTDSLAAENSATAAATSESNAAASETASASSASAANADRVAAQTARDDAQSSASAALTSEQNASASQTAAASSASAASSDAGSASTSAANALSYRNTAQSARDDAESAAAEAVVSEGVVARLRNQGMSLDPTFSLWDGVSPNHALFNATAGSSATKLTGSAAKYTNAVQLTTGTDRTVNTPYVFKTYAQGQLRGNPDGEYYVVTAELERRSGNMAGASLRLLWDADTNSSVFWDLFGEFGNFPGTEIVRVQRVFRRTNPPTGLTDFVLYFFLNHVNYNNSNTNTLIMRVHSLDVREASEEEIAAYNVGDTIDTEVAAAVAVETAARVSSEGQAEANYTIRTQAVTGGTRAMTGIDLFSLANPDGSTTNDIVMMADRMILAPSTTAPLQPMFSISGDVAYFNTDLVADGSIFGNQLHATAINKIQNPARVTALADVTWTGDIFDVTEDFANLGGANALRIRGGANADKTMYSDYFDIESTKTYKIATDMYCGHVDGRRLIGGYFYDKDGNSIVGHNLLGQTSIVWNAVGGDPYFFNESGANGRVNMVTYLVGHQHTAEEAPVSEDFRVIQIPENAVSMRLRFGIYDHTSTVNAYITNCSISDADAGLITGNRLVANSVDTGALAANSITAVELNVNTLNSVASNTGALTVSGNVQSSNFSTASKTGFRIQSSGASTFYDPVISRDLVLQSGTFVAEHTFGQPSSAGQFGMIYEDAIITTLPITEFANSEKALYVYCELEPGITLTTTDPDWRYYIDAVPFAINGPDEVWIRFQIWRQHITGIKGTAGGDDFYVNWEVREIT